MVQKKVHLTVLRRALECAILLPALYWVSHRGGDAIDIAAANLMVSLSLVPLTVWLVAWVLRIPVLHIYLLLWRPLVAGLALFAANSLLLSGLDLNPFVSLLVNVLLGVPAYASTLYVLWLACGRPQSPEQILLDIAQRASRQVRSRLQRGTGSEERSMP
ncbi:MAG: hypothetical protein ACK5HY_11090, partial [Parahaliea sp.]